MSCDANGRNSLLFVKCVEPCMAWGEGSRIPPLGTLNANLNDYTSHSNNNEIGATNNLYTEAYIGAFWLVTGKSDLSFSVDFDKMEIASMDAPKRFVRGRGTYSGSLGVNKEPDIPRWEAAANGDWDASMCIIGEGRKFVLYEFWLLENPDEPDYTATKADLLIKYYGVSFDSEEKSYAGPLAFTFPISIVYREKFPNWENGKMGSADGVQYDVEILTTPKAGSTLPAMTWNAGTPDYLSIPFSAINQSGTLQFGDNGASNKLTPIHTRLAFRRDGAAGQLAMSIKVSGMTVYGVWMEETIDFPAGVAAGDTYDVVSTLYFYKEFYVVYVSGDGTDTLKVAPVDHVLRTAYSGFPFL